MQRALIIAGLMIIVANLVSAQANPHSGLLNHQVQWAVSGKDKVLRTVPGVLLEKASVPDAVATPDGDLLYYVNGEPGKHGIYVARVASNSRQVLGPVLIDGQFDGNAVDPDAVRLADGRIRLFFFKGWFVSKPDPASDISPFNPIYSAISSDGRNFTLEGKVFEFPDIADPSVIQLKNGNWLMACANGRTGMILARSIDGKTFIYEAHNFARGIPELVIMEDGSIKLLYNVRGGFGAYLSNDSGRTWQKESDLFFHHDAAIADPSVVSDDQGMRLYFKSFKSALKQPAFPAAAAQE